jgi:hypothetical protein
MHNRVRLNQLAFPWPDLPAPDTLADGHSTPQQLVADGGVDHNLLGHKNTPQNTAYNHEDHDRQPELPWPAFT